MMLARTKSLAGQFVFDVQTHFVRDEFKHQELLDLAGFASEHWNPQMKQEGVSSLARYKFQNYMKEIYYDSDTTMALLSGARSTIRAGGCCRTSRSPRHARWSMTSRAHAACWRTP